LANKIHAVLAASLCLAPMAGIAQISEATDPASAPAAPAAPADSTVAETVDSIPVSGPATPETAEPAAASRGNRFVEEVVVTAQKREENVQDVPLSVQAFSAEMLDAKGIEDPKALAQTSPGMNYSQFAGYSIIFIRGVGTDAFIPSADASIATYIDNVYYPFSHGLAQSFGALERIEILKGPQGTLFGRNSTGGAINVVTKQPSQTPETEIQLSAGSYSATNARLYTNIPVTDTVAFSISGLYNREDSYYKYTPASLDSGPPSEISKGFRAKLGWTPIDNLSVVLSATNTELQGANSTYLPATDIKPLGIATGVTEAPPYKVGISEPGYIHTSTHVYSADVKYSTPWFDTRLIGAKQNIISPAIEDYDGSAQALVSFETVHQFADVKTGEFQILSNGDSWRAEQFKWIAGLFTIDSSAGYDPLYLSVGKNLLSYFTKGDPACSLGNFNSGCAVIPTAVNPLLNLAGRVPLLGTAINNVLTGGLNDGVNLSLEGVLDTKSTAGFFQGTWNFTDALALTLGGRYQTEERKLVKSNVSLITDYEAKGRGTRLITFSPQKVHTSNFAPKAVVEYKPVDDQMIYLSFTQGFKSGTYNIINIYTPPQYIKPEKVTAYELGYKSEWLDGTLRFNAAVFQNTIADLQVQTISLTSGGAVRFETAGGARIRGSDFDLTWQPAPDALPGLVVTGGGAYLHGIYTDYKEGSGYNETTGLFFDGTIFPTQDFTGHTVVRTPDFSGFGGLGYSFELGKGTLEVAGDTYYSSKFYYSAQNTQTASQDAYSVYNARISYLYDPWALRVALFGKNILDKKYSLNKTELDFGTSDLLAPPLTVGVRLNWTF
jgi:iron complex outermembrane receptor protein